MQRLRILTYNIHGGVGRDGRQDYRRIGRLMDDLETDIALLQEVETRPSDRSTDQDIADLCGSRFLYYVAAPSVRGPHGWFGNAVLSRYPLLDHQVHDITFKKREPRNIVDTLIDTPLGNFRILNTHKGLNRRERYAQMLTVNTLVSQRTDHPLVLAGDINEWHTSARVIHKLNEVLSPLLVGPTFPTHHPVFHLDRIWIRSDRTSATAKVIKTRETSIYSDHFPVMAEITPGTNGASGSLAH